MKKLLFVVIVLVSFIFALNLYAAKFDYVLLGSEVRQYDPARYSFDEDSVWFNGNIYWFMI